MASGNCPEPGSRDDLTIIQSEMNDVRLEDTMHKIYVKNGFSTPILGMLRYFPSADYIESQFVEDYLKLNNMSRSYLDDFVSKVVGLNSFCKNKEYIALARMNHYTRPALDDELKIDSKLHKAYLKPFTNQRMIKAVFPLIVLNEKIPCECSIDNFVAALDMVTKASEHDNLFPPVNMGYVFYHITPDTMKYTEIHKTGVGFNPDNLMNLILDRQYNKVPIDLSHEAIKKALDSNIDCIDSNFGN